MGSSCWWRIPAPCCTESSPSSLCFELSTSFNGQNDHQYATRTLILLFEDCFCNTHHTTHPLAECFQCLSCSERMWHSFLLQFLFFYLPTYSEKCFCLHNAGWNSFCSLMRSPHFIVLSKRVIFSRARKWSVYWREECVINAKGTPLLLHNIFKAFVFQASISLQNVLCKVR